MSSRYGWYGDPAIWAAVQAPDRGALGVVLCPPLGQEGVIAYRGLRFLADLLEQRGIASIRYDPPGQGDAAPSDDPAAPVNGARTAAALLRASGCTQIAFVGLSSAALIASQAAEPGDVVVLWSPPTSGRQWLRRARSMAAIELGEARHDGDTESLIGIDLTSAQSAYLSGLTLRLPGGAAALVATRREQPVPPGLGEADLIQVDGTAEFLDTVSMASVIPQAAITTIVEWLAAHAQPGDSALQVSALADELRLPSAVETIRWLGPNRLFAIECAPVVGGAEAPMVLLHAGAAEHRIGAGSFQVELARLLAADGARSIRADRRSAGETGPVRPEDPSLFYSAEWIEDQAAIVTALGLPGDRLAFTGLCAGGWLAGQPAPVAPRLVVAIHPLEYRTDPAAPGEYTDELVPEPIAEPSRDRLREAYRRWAPVWVRKLRDRWLGRSSVAPFLEGSAARSWRTVLIFSDLERMIFDRRGGPEAAHQLSSVELIDLPTADHALYARSTRERVIATVRRQVADAFGLPVAEPRPQ